MRDREKECRAARVRNKRRAVQDRLFRWLKKQPAPAPRKEASAAMGIDEVAMGHLLWRLSRRGLVFCQGRGEYARWWAKGGKPPAPVGGYRQDRVWRYLKDNPDSRPMEIASALGTRPASISQTLQRMKADGTAISAGGAYYNTWTAGTRPDPKWGLAAGSSIGLAIGHEEWRMRLAKAHQSRGITFTKSGCGSGQNVVQLVRERAPAKSVQIPSLGDLASSLLGD